MGLAEKRAIADFQEKQFPQIKADIEKTVGFPLELDVRWDTMAEPNQGERYPDLFQKVYFRPLTEALKSIAADEMGKNALKDALKKVVVDGSDGNHVGNFSFEGGVLTIKHKPFVNLDYVDERIAGIRKLIEAKL